MPGFTLSERYLHPEGVFPAQLVEYKEKPGQYGPRIGWVFETNIEKDDGTPAQVVYWTGTSFSNDPRCKLTYLCKALGIRIPETKEEVEAFDPEDLIGKVCRIRVIQQPGTDGSDWSNISDLIPNKKKGAEALEPASPPAKARTATRVITPEEAEAEDLPDPFEKES